MQPETTSHSKHTEQTSDNGSISKSIKRKDTKQGKLHKPQLQIHRKRNSRVNDPLQRNNKPTLCLQHRYIYIQQRYTQIIDCNKRKTSSVKVRQPIQERSKPSIDKTSEHDSSIYYGDHLLFSNVFYLMLLLNIRLFISFFYKYFRLYQ